MSIVHQSPVVSYSPFPPRLMLCAPRIAGLLCAPKAVPPPTPTPPVSHMARVAAYLEIASARLQARYERIDAEVEAMRLAYGMRPREITITGRTPQ